MIKLFLFDIEGTTTDINFVHKVLFPYAAKNLDEFMHAHADLQSVKAAIQSVQETVLQEEKKQIGTDLVIQKLHQWIKEDRKHPALKEIQGQIWDIGYVKNHFQGHVYPDVMPFFKKILTAGHKIGIYSSGSVHAQKLIFSYSTAGDLTPLISYYFDTRVGPKRDKASYERIAMETGLTPQSIHFFSDIPQEIAAAQEAGFAVTHVVREGNEKSLYKYVTNFNELKELL